jgi:hypothetical protein
MIPNNTAVMISNDCTQWWLQMTATVMTSNDCNSDDFKWLQQWWLQMTATVMTSNDCNSDDFKWLQQWWLQMTATVMTSNDCNSDDFKWLQQWLRVWHSWFQQFFFNIDLNHYRIFGAKLPLRQQTPPRDSINKNTTIHSFWYFKNNFLRYYFAAFFRAARFLTPFITVQTFFWSSHQPFLSGQFACGSVASQSTCQHNYVKSQNIFSHVCTHVSICVLQYHVRPTWSDLRIHGYWQTDAYCNIILSPLSSKDFRTMWSNLCIHGYRTTDGQKSFFKPAYLM